MVIATVIEFGEPGPFKGTDPSRKGTPLSDPSTLLRTPFGGRFPNACYRIVRRGYIPICTSSALSISRARCRRTAAGRLGFCTRLGKPS